MARKLFCEWSPLTYEISVHKCRLQRKLQDALTKTAFAKTFQEAPLPIVVYCHKSLIRRKLGNVNLQLQENKAVNLSLAAPKIHGICIRPGETFSFWQLVGNPRAKEGYLEGMTITKGAPNQGIGGGMCQFTNLIHWLILHTPLTIVEHHHHDSLDLFPDFNRQIPFGTGTSIFYNYIDYRFRNDTDQCFQLMVSVSEDYLQGEIRCAQPLPLRYHIHVQGEQFIQEGGDVFRLGTVFRNTIDIQTGKVIETQKIKENRAKVLYDIDPQKITRCPSNGEGQRNQRN